MNPETEELWRVRCECGAEMIVSRSDLESGAVTSCGCGGEAYFYCLCEGGRLISSTPIETCRKQCERN